MAVSKSFTNNEIKDWIRNILSKSVVGVEPDRLSDYLVQENVITPEQWQKIHTDHPTRQSRCRALLHYLFCIPHPRAFLVVYQALAEEKHYLLESIVNQEPISGTGSQPDIQIVLQACSKCKTKLQPPGKDFEDQKKAWEAERDRSLKLKKELETNIHMYRKKIEQLKKDNEDQKRAWEEEKGRLLKIQEEHEDQKRAWEAEKDRLLKMQKDLEKKPNVEEDALDSKKTCEQSLLAEQSNEIDLLRKENMELKQELEVTKTVTDKLRYIRDPVLVQTIRTRAAEEGEKPIIGLTVLDKELFVVSEKSSEVEVYDSIKFSFNRRWKLKELIYPRDAVSCNRNKCLYINDYKGSDQSKEILRIDRNGTLVNKWSTGDDYGWGLSVTYESNVILTDYNKTKLNEYSPDGQLVREVILSSIVGIRSPRHAIQLSNGHFVVSHGLSRDDLHQVCVVDADGKLQKSFGGQRGSDLGQMNSPVYLSVDKNGFVMVVDRWNSRVLLLDSDLEFKRVIVSKAGKHGLRNPFKILLDESNGRVLVADNAWDSEKKIFTDGRILILDFN